MDVNVDYRLHEKLFPVKSESTNGAAAAYFRSF